VRRRRFRVYQGEAGTRPRRLPPSDNPREVRPGEQAEPNLQHGKTNTRSTEVTFKAWLKVSVLGFEKPKTKRGPARGGVDRASSRGIIGNYAAGIQLSHIMLWFTALKRPQVAVF
jgi:hypothetical protein